MAKAIVGVDIGSTSLRAVEILDPSKANPTVVRAHEVPLPDGSVKRGEILEMNTVASAFKRLWAGGGFRTKNVALGIGGQNVIVRDLAVPRASLAEIKQALPFQVQDLLPVAVDDAVLDFYPISEGVSETGPTVHGLLVAAVKNAISMNVNTVKMAGLNPVSMDLLPFAITRMHTRAHPTAGVAAHLHIGANAMSMVIAQAGVPQLVRVIPSGGDNATRTIMGSLALSREKAEGLKRNLGLSHVGHDDEQRRAAELIRESTEELVTAVRSTLTYFVGVRPRTVFDHISVTGGVSRMTGFTAALAESTRVSVVPVNPLSMVSLARPLRAKVSDDQVQSWTTAIGLAMGSAS